MTRESEPSLGARRLSVRAFGHLAVELDGVPIRISRQGAGLLVYLSTQLGKSVQRATLANLLWSHHDERKARHSLSQLTYSLNLQLPKGCIQSDAMSVTLGADYVLSDVHQFNVALAEGRFRDALALYAGSLLEGVPFLTEEFDDWRSATAASLEADAVAACVGLITEALEQEDHDRAAEMARRGLLISPASEFFARIRIESLAASGDIGGALRELESAKKRRLIETGQVPASLTDTLASRITRLPTLAQQPASSGLKSRFVGRGQEIRLLRGEWELAKSAFRIAVLRGEPGIGKSRLLQHSARWSVLDGARSFMYACSEVESRLPHSAIVGLLRDGFRSHDLRKLDSRWQHALASIAPELFSSPERFEDAPRIVWEAVAQYYIAICCEAPVVIGLDDYQWVDESSRQMLAYLAKRLPEQGIHLLLAGRGLLAAPTYEDDTASTRFIDLLPLSATDTEQLVAEFEASYSIAVDDTLRRLLIDKVGGRPFFLMEALRHIRDAGTAVSTSVLTSDLMSPNLEQHFKRRFDGLSPIGQAICAVAAVINREASVAIMAKAAGLSVLSAASAVEELVRSGLLADVSSPRFAHALVRDAALGALTASQRRVWHLRVAASIAEYEPQRLSEIAGHLEEGGDSDAAFGIAEAAATEAINIGAYADAEEQFRRMLRCAKPSQRVNGRSGLVKLLVASGRFSEVQDYLAEVETYCAANGDYEGLVACGLARYWLSEQEGQLDAEVTLTQAREIVELAERYTPHQLTSVLWQVSDTMRRSGEVDLLGRFTNLLESNSLRADGAASADMLAIAALMAGSVEGHQRSLELATRAVAISEQLDDPALVLRSSYARGTARFWTGDVIGARADYDALLSADASEVPDSLSVRVKSNYAVLLMEQGEYDAADQYAQEALREAGAVRRAYAFGNLALINLRRGNWLTAQRYADALLIARDTTPQMQLHAQALLGLADVANGQLTSAKERNDIIVSSTVRSDALGDLSHIYLLRAALAGANGEHATAVSVLNSGIQSIAAKEAIAALWLELEMAKYLPLLGRVDEAVVRLRRGIEFSERGGAWALHTCMKQLLCEIRSQSPNDTVG